MGFLWLALAAAFALVEGLTVQVISIWFALGSVAGMIASFFGASVTVQVLIAVIISVITLLLFRGFVVKVLKPKNTRTNADSLIGKTIVVTEKVRNVFGEGAGKINGLEWKLKSEDGSDIEAGAEAEIKAIKGVTLIVAEKTKAAEKTAAAK